MTKLQKVFAKNIKYFREAEGLSQAALAERAGISLNFMSMIEIAQKFPSPTNIESIASALKVNPYILFIDLDGPSPMEDPLVAKFYTTSLVAKLTRALEITLDDFFHPDKRVKIHTDLRTQAQDRLKTDPSPPRPGTGGLTHTEAEQLLHDLQVHQVELEIQNEELRTAQIELEKQKTEYLDLYDQAPVGYVTVSADGAILKANSAMRMLLWTGSQPLVGQHLSKFEASGDKLYFLFKTLRTNRSSPPVTLGMKRGASETFWARVDSSITEEGPGGFVFLLVFHDISNEMSQGDSGGDIIPHG